MLSPLPAGKASAPPAPAAPPRRAARPIAREARLARRLLWLIPTGTLAFCVLLRVLVTSDMVTQPIAEAVAGAIADRTRTSVQLSGLTFDLDFAPCLEDLTLVRAQGPFELRVVSPRACVARWGSAVGSGFRAVRLELESPFIEVVGQGKGERPPVPARPRLISARPEGRPALREVEVVFDDLELRLEDLPVPDRLATGTFGPIDGQVTLQVRGAQSAAIIALRDPDRGGTLNARANPTETGWNLSAGLSGDLVPFFGSLLEGSTVDLRKMPVRGRAGVSYRTDTERLTVDLDVEQYDVELASEAMARGVLAGFTARQRGRAEIDLEGQTLDLEDGLVEVNGVPVVLSVKVRPGETSPAFEVKADLRTTPFARLVASIPGSEELDILRRISPSITFAMSAAVSGELRNPETWEPRVEHRFTSIDPKRTFTGLEFLSDKFEYHPLGPEGRLDTAIVVGPRAEGWVPYRRIPYVQRRAIIVSEDANFPFHRGLDLDEVKSALQDAMDGETRARGGSTISQQLVKNLFLSRDRTAQRKLVELLLTFHLESWLSKDEIFALYANIIEWGPDIYGIGAASQHYFGRPARRLEPLEAAYLATLIPSPVRLHAHYDKGAVPNRHLRKVHRLLERLNRLGQLSDEALMAAKSRRVRFAPRPAKEKKR